MDNSNIMRRITVLAPSFALTAILAIVPALARIAGAFPEVSATAVQMLVTLPSLIAFPIILVSGALAGIMTKKRIVSLSLALMLIGGLLPVFIYHSFPFLLFCGVVFGLGLGGLSPMTTALVYEHYSEEQNAMMGYMGSFLCAGGMLFSFIGGFLASIHWRFAYLTYLILIPVLILVLMLPKGAVIKSSIHFGGLFNGALVYYIIQCIITTIAYNAFNTNIAMYIEAAGLGDARTAGIVTSVYSAVGILGGIVTGRVIGRLKKYTLPVLFLAAGIGMLCIYLSQTLILAIIGAFLIGFTFSIYMPAGYGKATQSAPAEAATMAIAVYCCSHQLGQFLTPVVINGTSALFGSGVDARFLSASIILIAMFIIAALRERRF